MSLSPQYSEQLALTIAELYQRAELAILKRLAASLGSIPDGGSVVLELARVQNLRTAAIRDLAVINRQAADELLRILSTAYMEGALSAYHDAGERFGAAAAIAPAQQAAVAAAAASVLEGAQSAIAPAIARVDEAYRRVIAESVADAVTGAGFRRDLAQRALLKLADEGVYRVPTARGSMRLDDYVTMATRTGVRQTLVQGHEQGMRTLGLSLCTVQPGPRACPICDRWARAILSIDGSPAGTYTVENVRTGEPMQVTVRATLAEARDAGWGHPNCRCRLRAWLPGASDPKDLQRPPFDAKGYAAQQRQRQLERGIRQWKSREAAAFTPAAKTLTGAKVREWQGAMRAHMDANPALKRQYRREQIGRAI